MRLKYIDVLKFVAILAVVLYHSGFLPFGYLGVDLFLVINGYLITKSLLGRFFPENISANGAVHTSVWQRYLTFELSRIVRLLPVLLVAGMSCMALGYFIMLPDDYENLSESVVATNLFGNNILAAITTKNYWDVANEYKPLMHTWYVGLIMQFYIIYPVLFCFAKLDKQNPHRTLLTIVSTTAFASLLVYLGTTNSALRFYYLPSRYFEFALGGIVALTWNNSERTKIFHNWFVFLCYALLIVLLAVNVEIISSSLRLVVVVALSVVLLLSNEVLDNRVTANGLFATIGAASYSIFVWHQVLLAFFRYIGIGHFTVASYAVYLFIVAIASWLSYNFIEKRINLWLNDNKQTKVFYLATVMAFSLLTGFAGLIYLRSGVVRDVPELYISKDNIHRGLNAEYVDRAFLYDRPFETKKSHWLVIGNSFGRDFVNVILESDIADSVEISYLQIDKDFKKPEYASRFENADRVFLSSLGVSEALVSELEITCEVNGLSLDRIMIVGEKNFGETNGQFYIHRNSPNYFEQRTKVRSVFIEKNKRLKALYGDRYLDMISLLMDDYGTVPVFTPDHHFISQDCEHFSKGGAVLYSTLIDWDLFMAQ